MRQIVLAAPGELIDRYVQRPRTLPGEALVRISCAGVCGSDVRATGAESCSR